jgi:hypothetical protein
MDATKKVAVLASLLPDSCCTMSRLRSGGQVARAVNVLLLGCRYQEELAVGLTGMTWIG